MIPRKELNNIQKMRRLRGTLINKHDPRGRNDAYWALRLQGYSHTHAKRVFRDMLPRFYKEEFKLSDDYIEDIDPDDLVVIPPVDCVLQKMAVVVRPDLTEETVLDAPARDTEYTIWSESPNGFGMRVRPSGARSYVVMFRINNTSTQGKVTLGKVGSMSLGTAKKMAVEIRWEARMGNDPRPLHKSGEIHKRVDNDYVPSGLGSPSLPQD